MERGSAVARETVTLFGLAISSDRTVLYERFDAAVARRLFIRHALVEGEWESEHAFVQRNDARTDAVIEIETRERRGDLLVDDDVIAEWFNSRVPLDVTSVQRFDAWWRTVRETEPHRFDLSEDDLIDSDAGAPDEESFPRSWHYGDLALPLEYEFNPASPSDGVTIEIPVASLDRIDPSVFESNVPGLRDELVTALLRSLPKHVRRQFAPVKDTAKELGPELDDTDGRLVESLARALTRRSNDVLRADYFPSYRVPVHLKPRYRVSSEDGSVLAEGDDLVALKSQLQHLARQTLAESAHSIERSEITSWDFGSLPQSVVIEGETQAIVAYPSLVDDGESVSIRLLATESEQADAMWLGLRRLVLLDLPSPSRLLRGVLTDIGPVTIAGGPYENSSDWMNDCMNCAVDSVLVEFGGMVWSEVEFTELMDTVRADLSDSVETIGRQAAGVMESLHRANVAVESTSNAVFGDVLDDIDQQIDRFVFDGFISAVGSDRLDDVRRYLDAVVYRLEKLRENPHRDRERMQRVIELEEELDDLTDVLSWSSELVEAAWMLQELRVSLFAQPIGVKGTISEKRIRSALQDLLT